MAARAKYNQFPRCANIRNVLKVLRECSTILKALRERARKMFLRALRESSTKFLKALREPFRKRWQQAMRETADIVNFAARASADIPSGHARSRAKKFAKLAARAEMNARAPF